MLRTKYDSWKKSYRSRTTYCTTSRAPFFNIAGKYLPPDENAIVVDIGAGKGEFADDLKLESRCKNLFLLDGSSTTIEHLQSRFKNAILYRAPGELPFETATVSFVHCSHLIEHLNPQDLYRLLKEVDRILHTNGVFVVSAPLLWEQFYADLSHVRPYEPLVFLNYLCRTSGDRSADMISERYSFLELVYRYATLDFDEGWGSPLLLVDIAIQLWKRVLSTLGLRRYQKSGYTLVLSKGK